MKTLGVIGGIAPESAVDYYRSIIAAYRQKKQDGSYPAIIINSIDLKKMLDLVPMNALASLAEYLGAEVQKLARAGADFGLLASNTPHIVFDDVLCHSPIPLLSIVEATCEAAKGLGLKRLGLLGTRFTMQGRLLGRLLGGGDDLGCAHGRGVSLCPRQVHGRTGQGRLLA
jgi:aspartate racemase